MTEGTILIVEDEKALNRFIELELKHEGYEVIKAYDGKDGLDKALESSVDLVILDLMLPYLSGIEVCRRIRKTSMVPVIMLTAKDDVTDKVSGLDSGADDYMTKPFQIEELLARIRVALNRQKRLKDTSESSILEKNGLEIDIKSHHVSFKGEVIDLTKKEYDLLLYLLEKRGQVAYREEIIQNVWGYDFIGETKVVDVYVRYIRAKIDQKYNVEFIKTVRGVGYMIDA